MRKASIEFIRMEVLRIKIAPQEFVCRLPFFCKDACGGKEKEPASGWLDFESSIVHELRGENDIDFQRSPRECSALRISEKMPAAARERPNDCKIDSERNASLFCLFLSPPLRERPCNKLLQKKHPNDQPEMKRTVLFAQQRQEAGRQPHQNSRLT